LPLHEFEVSGCIDPVDDAFEGMDHKAFAGTTGIPGLARANRENGVKILDIIENILCSYAQRLKCVGLNL